jgi:hypothetical protein
MPFTLAHPAAVLPLRRYCPRVLSFPALVLGSLTPDVGYCFREWDVDIFSHGLLGSVVFCLPVGLIMLAFYYVARPFAIRFLPGRYSVSPFAFLPSIFGILVGAWSHIVWDSFTNRNGWAVLRVPILQANVFSVAEHQVEVCHLLWYGCSCAGVGWLSLEYLRWRMGRCTRDQRMPAAAVAGRGKMRWWRAAVAAVLVLPIGIIHHLVHGLPGFLLVAALSALLMIIVGFNLQLETRFHL